MIISQKIWNRLNDDEKIMIREAAAEAQKFQREATAASMDKAKATLAGAMTVNEITPAQKDRMRERVQPVIDKFAKSLDGNLVKMMYEEVAKVRATQ